MTGTPLRKMDFMSSELALAEPVPFTVAILIAKSFTLSGISGAHSSSNKGKFCVRGCRFIGGVWPLDSRLLHVPGRGRAALGAQAAVHAQVFVFDHDAAGMFQRRRYVQGLSDILRGRLEPSAQIGFLTIRRDGQAIHRADVDARVALDAQLGLEHRLHIAIEAAL